MVLRSHASGTIGYFLNSSCNCVFHPRRCSNLLLLDVPSLRSTLSRHPSSWRLMPCCRCAERWLTTRYDSKFSGSKSDEYQCNVIPFWRIEETWQSLGLSMCSLVKYVTTVQQTFHERTKYVIALFPATKIAIFLARTSIGYRKFHMRKRADIV